MSENRARSNGKGWTKARAVLAGGLVLGVGAAITLAAWSDQEWVTGLFGSGTFGIEGSADGTAFSDHSTQGDAAELSFAVGADALAPDETVYAGYAVQLIAGSTNEGLVTVAQDTSAALVGTTASYVLTDSITCDAQAFAAGTSAVDFTLGAPEAPQFICFAVAADDTLVQGETGQITWTFNAESADAI